MNRIGDDPQANMITRDIMGYFQAGKTYQLTNKGTKNKLCIEFNQIDSIDATIPLQKVVQQATVATIPEYASLSGAWLHDEVIAETEANILGGMGSLIINHTKIEIPVVAASNDNLSYYNACLVAIGETVQFESNEDLPITLVHVGKNYVAQYLTQIQHGGGEYIEYHDQPHFWMPCTTDCSGHILLGKKENDHFHFTGFSIPFGYAVYMSPYTLHSDAYLIGDFIVVYTIATQFSTVLIKDQNQKTKLIEFISKPV